MTRLSSRRAFTLIELLLAGAAAAILLAAMYGLFTRAVKLRDNSEARTREARLRARAVAVLRNDLLNAHMVGLEMNGGLVGSETSERGTRFPGYLRFTTSTGRDTQDFPYGDSQEVEYYIDTDPERTDTSSGVLMRAVDRVLLADTREVTDEQRLLQGIASMEVSFYDGTDWTSSWEISDTAKTTPGAVRVTIYPLAKDGEKVMPIEVLVNWSIVQE